MPVVLHHLGVVQWKLLNPNYGGCLLWRLFFPGLATRQTDINPRCMVTPKGTIVRHVSLLEMTSPNHQPWVCGVPATGDNQRVVGLAWVLARRTCSATAATRAVKVLRLTILPAHSRPVHPTWHLATSVIFRLLRPGGKIRHLLAC